MWTFTRPPCLALALALTLALVRRPRGDADDSGPEVADADPAKMSSHARLSLVTGVRTDCKALLQRFCAEDSMRFRDFAHCWRAMLFSHMLR